MRTQSLVMSLVILVSGTAFGQSLKQKKLMAAEDESFKEKVAQTDSSCGTKLNASIDWSSFKKDKDNLEKYSISGFCGDGLEAMRALCSDALAKTEISKQIKTYKCTLGGKGKRASKLAGGTFTASVDFEAANSADFFKDQLENSL